MRETTNLMENRIVVIVTFHNAARYILECYQSLVNQQYDNYVIIFIDDNSFDNSSTMIPNSDKVIKVSHSKRNYALHNIWQSLTEQMLFPNDIIIFVDGDDYLIDDQVFNIVNNIYNENGCLLTFGQYVDTTGKHGHCKPYSEDEFRNLRKQNWKASHLRTFRYKLYQDFLVQDPTVDAYKNSNGEFYNTTYDVALMYPLMEIAGFKNVYFNNKVLYMYRIHELNDMSVNRQAQIDVEMDIRSKAPFKRIYNK